MQEVLSKESSLLKNLRINRYVSKKAGCLYQLRKEEKERGMKPTARRIAVFEILPKMPNSAYV